MEFIKELFLFLRQRKKYWLAPLIIMIVIIGAMTVIAGGSALAPFIYSLF